MPIRHRHPLLRLALPLAAAAALVATHVPARAQAPKAAAPAAAQAVPLNNYPTSARVEYVGECLAKNGGAYVFVHKCSCVIDQIANKMTYDDYVDSSTFSRYATLGGEGGAIFRDPPEGKREAKRYRDTEAEAQRTCGIGPATNAAR